MKKVLFAGLFLLICFYFIYNNYIKNKSNDFIYSTSYISKIELDNNNLKIKFKFPYDLNKKNIYCMVSKNNEIENQNDASWILIKNNECDFKIEQGVYYLFLKNNDEIIKVYDTIDLKYITNFKFEKDKVYLSINGSEKLKIKMDGYGNISSNDIDIIYSVENSEVASIDENGIVTGHKDGFTKVYASYNGKETSIDVVVTSVITNKPTTFDYGKVRIGCHVYNQEQASLLDEILFSRIDDAGYKTRAGVVAAVRFLMFEFPYRINYFSENGRLDGFKKVDGEGRYYHRGLYLSDNKFDVITKAEYGPAIWGCSLFSYLSNKQRGNGLDCSGFVTWSLINGGFDVGDIGAGPISGALDLTDYGVKTDLTTELIYSNKIKAGDLIGYDGHIAIIAGIDDNYIYVAEALWEGTYGVVATQYKKSDINKTLHYVMLMDSYYKEDGNYTDMWY